MEKKSEFDAVIVANGDFPTHATPLAVLQDAMHVVACDGAAAHFSFSPSLHFSFSIIGDGDSVPDEYRDRLIRIDEQDDNDLTKATRYCLAHHTPPAAAHSPLRIAYLGCTGRREDHTLGNIALMMRYYREFAVLPTMFTDYGTFTPARGDRTFPSFPGQQVSIVNFGSTRILSENLKWPSYAYDEWWQGTLNEALADHFTLHADGYYMVYQTYEAK